MSGSGILGGFADLLEKEAISIMRETLSRVVAVNRLGSERHELRQQNDDFA